MQKRAFSQVAQHALVGAGIGGALGTGVGYLRGEPENRGRSMLSHGAIGAVTGGLIGAGSGFNAQGGGSGGSSTPLPNVNPLDPSAAKRMDRIRTVLRGYNGLGADVHKHMGEYADLAKAQTLTQQQVDRMRALAQQYAPGVGGNPEHVSNFFQAAAHRYEPKVAVASFDMASAHAAVAAYAAGMDYAFDLMGL